MKPYFVKLSVNAVVMANNQKHAMDEALKVTDTIAFDNDFIAESAIEVESLDCLLEMSSLWTGNCIPYNDDVLLKEVLPQTKLSPTEIKA